MTEHFTREEADKFARQYGLPVGIGCPNWHHIVNTTFAAKLKEWEGQGAVAWCELNLSRTGIAYFDGKPVIMTGPVGNDCHPTPLFTHAKAAPVVGVPDIDYKLLIEACFAITKQAQGTRGCVQFAKGAEWFREFALAASAQPEQKEG